MDESLSDFQEKKKGCIGPKDLKKSKTRKANPRKPVKRIKGQKDIRTVLKSKKNELISYSKEFDSVCKQSGVDVDPEQLQLAIALSNSLHDKESTTDSDVQSLQSNSQSRISKIRTTLQQYGFKTTKITNTIVNRKVRKHRKSYKLLTISDSERLQAILDRYGQVLLQNVSGSKINREEIEFEVSDIKLYNKATNIPYKYLRNSDMFYVNELVEKSFSSGCLLKDWSSIPGRPSSPTLKNNNDMDFTQIECSQEELDVVLSGTIQCSRIIFKNKENEYLQKDSDKLKGNVVTNHDGNAMSDLISDVTWKAKDDMTNKRSELLTVQHRSCSPDIFDDDESVIFTVGDKTDVKDDKIEDINQKLCVSNDVMDLTECVNIKTLNSVKLSTQVSQKYDETKRKSNDFMEMTECVATGSQPILENNANIDLTQRSDTDNDETKTEAKIDGVESMDLTQSSDSSLDLPFVHISQKVSDKSLDDTIILNDNDYSEYVRNYDPVSEINKNECVDLTKEVNINIQHNNETIFDENVLKPCSQINSSSSFTNNLDQNNVDLTQSSNSSADADCETPKNPTLGTSFGSTNLGNKYNISIDYDELFDEVCGAANETPQTPKNTTPNSILTNTMNNENDIQTQSEAHSCSQSSEVFDIVDQELDYSMHKSRLEDPFDNFDFGGTLVTNSSSFRTTMGTRDDTLPIVDIRKAVCYEGDNHIQDDNNSTPIKDVCQKELIIKTPNNGDYIVKTDGVTPMPDYESMSSPDRNRELDKYGLKPFKRKRAINLLTYLYNQTHPIAEPCSSGELQSPSKKAKLDFKSPNTSPKKNRSPIKNKLGISPDNLSSPMKDHKKDDLFEQSDELPVLSEIYCNEDDWVFQKREKPKVHSCRVPLHIAFHNYVSCRRALREAILCYEPINIDVVHKDLVHSGYRYDPKDLLKFLDKKCITVKTKDNNTRNNKR